MYVEGPWAALGWALGGAGVLAKHALISLFIPGNSGQAITPQGGLFAKEVSMRKATLITTGGCILAVLLLFVAPGISPGVSTFARAVALGVPFEPIG